MPSHLPMSDKPGRAVADPFSRLHREMNRLFEDFLPARLRGEGVFDPEIDVAETESEVRVSVELPGVAEKDVEVRLDDDMLVIRGEKRSERNDEKEHYRFTERSFGAFQRALRIPAKIDAEKIRAKFDSGVLTVTLPKDPKAENGRRIAIEPGGKSGAR